MAAGRIWTVKGSVEGHRGTPLIICLQLLTNAPISVINVVATPRLFTISTGVAAALSCERTEDSEITINGRTSAKNFMRLLLILEKGIFVGVLISPSPVLLRDDMHDLSTSYHLRLGQ